MKILKPFYHAARRFSPGQETELENSKPSEEQVQSWQARGLLESKGGATAKSDGSSETELTDALQEFARTGESLVETLERVLQQSETAETELEELQVGVEALAAKIADSVDLSRSSNETALQFLGRYADLLPAVPANHPAEIRQSGNEPSEESPTSTPLTVELTAEEAVVPLTAEKLTGVVGAKAALSLLKEGFDTRAKFAAKTDKELEDLPDVGAATVKKIRDWLKG